MQRTFVKEKALDEARAISALVGHQGLLITVEDVEKYNSAYAKDKVAKGIQVGEQGKMPAKQPASTGRLQSNAAKEAAKGTRCFYQ